MTKILGRSIFYCECANLNNKFKRSTVFISGSVGPWSWVLNHHQGQRLCYIKYIYEYNRFDATHHHHPARKPTLFLESQIFGNMRDAFLSCLLNKEDDEETPPRRDCCYNTRQTSTSHHICLPQKDPPLHVLLLLALCNIVRTLLLFLLTTTTKTTEE